MQTELMKYWINMFGARFELDEQMASDYLNQWGGTFDYTGCKPQSESTYRRLMPIELERLNQFPDNWTDLNGISDSRRGFLMGNALVIGVVELLAEPIARLFQNWSE